MGPVDDAAFEVARSALLALLAPSMARLDLRARARVAIALGRPQGGWLDGVAPTALRRRFVEGRPAVDGDQVRPLLRSVLRSLGMPECEGSLVLHLEHAALLDGRRRLGWPEIVLFAALLEEEGAPAAAIVLAERLHGDASRISALATGLQRLDGFERERCVPQTDAESRPLYRGPDGSPTTEAVVDVQMYDRSNAPLYRAPPEMARDPYRRAYAEEELWRQHFATQPEGRARLRAWVNDPMQRVTVRTPLRALVTATEAEPAHVLSRLCDVAILERLGVEHARELDALRSLDDGSDASSIVAPLEETFALRSALRVASAQLDEALFQLRGLAISLAGAIGATVGASTDECAALATLIEALPCDVLEAAAREPNGTLLERVQLAADVDAWLSTGGELALASIHPALCALIDARTERTACASLLRSLLRAQRMLERGTRALGALAVAEGHPARAGSQDAGHELALELATAALQRNLSELASAPRT